MSLGGGDEGAPTTAILAWLFFSEIYTPLAAMGMAPFTRTGHESHSVTTCTVPAGVKFDELYAGLKARGFIAYACKDVLAERFMQVANMGEMSLESIDAFLAAVAAVIAEIRGRAVESMTASASDAGDRIAWLLGGPSGGGWLPPEPHRPSPRCDSRE